MNLFFECYAQNGIRLVGMEEVTRLSGKIVRRG